MYSKIKLIVFNTAFCTWVNGTQYSFIKAGKTVNGPQESAITAMAMLVHILLDLS